MDFFEVIAKRKAIRKYLSGKTIPEKDIAKILETASLAPSARHLQSYKVFCVKSPANIGKVFQAYYNQRTDFIKNAALILIFCTDPEQAIASFGDRGKNLYTLQDATIAASFSILAATALGYATCWVGNFDEQKVKEILQTILMPVATIIIGYGDEDPQRPARKPLSDLVKYCS